MLLLNVRYGLGGSPFDVQEDSWGYWESLSAVWAIMVPFHNAKSLTQAAS